MAINHGVYTDTSWNVPVVFTESDGDPRNMSGVDYVLQILSAKGQVAFTFRSSSPAADEGQIGLASAASGQLNFSATETQHAAVTAGLYKAHLYVDAADDVWIASGRLLVGKPGATSTYLIFDRFSSSGPASVALPVVVQHVLSDGSKGDISVSTGVWHFERTNGSPGNGVDDDIPWWNDQLDAGKTVVLSDLKQYVAKRSCIFTVAGTGIVAPNGARIKMSTAAGAFDNTVYGNRYSTSNLAGAKYAVGFYGENLEGLFIENVHISLSTWVDDRYLKAIALRECDNAYLRGVEISNFSRGDGVLSINDCDGVQIENPHIHHVWTNSLSGDASQAQVSAICVDSDALVGSKRGRIANPLIEHITVGDLARAARGYQADAISFRGHSTVKPTLDWIVEGGSIYNTGEGVDCFGSGNIFHGITFRRCFGAGMKLIYGASRNCVSSNIFHEMGLYAILLSGVNNVGIVGDVDANSISNNQIYGVNIEGDWLNADGGKSYDSAAHGATPWGAANNAGLRVDGNVDGQNSNVTNLDIHALTVDCGGTGKYGVFISNVAGNGVVTGTALTIRNTTVARLSDAGGKLIESDLSTSAGRALAAAADVAAQRALLAVPRASGDLAAVTDEARLLARHDLISGAWNGTFEVGDHGWVKETASGTGWFIDTDSANARTGLMVARNNNTTGANLQVYSTARKFVLPGETVYAEAWVKSSAGATFATCRVVIRWLDKDGVALSTSFGSNINTEQLSYVRTSLSAAAPANAVYYTEGVQVASKTAGTIWADAVSSYRRRPIDSLGVMSAASVAGNFSATNRIAIVDAAGVTWHIPASSVAW